MKISLKTRFYLSILPLAIILPFLLYSLAAPYGQLYTLFGNYEIDTKQALDAKKIESGIHQEYLALFHIIAISSTHKQHTNADLSLLYASQQSIKESFASLKSSLIHEDIGEQTEEREAIEMAEKNYNSFSSLGTQALALHEQGKFDAAIIILNENMTAALESSLMPQIENISGAETHDVETNLPLLVGIINRFGVVPIPTLQNHMEEASTEFRNTLLAQELYRLMDTLQIETFHQLYNLEENEHAAHKETVEAEIDETLVSLRKAIEEENDAEEAEEKTKETTQVDTLEKEYQSTKSAINTVITTFKDHDASKAALLLEQSVSTPIDTSLRPKIQQFAQQEENTRKKTVEELRNYLQTIVYIIYTISGFVFLIGIIGVISLSRQIIRPIIILRDATTKLAANDFSVRVNLNSHDELGELAHSFNAMAANLQASYTTLEEKVKEKTAELGNKIRESEERNRELEDTKKATLNILEDLADEKTKLQTSKAKDEAILSSIGDGIIGIDDQGRIIVLNKAAEDMLGVTSGSLLDQWILKAIVATDEKGEVLPSAKQPMSEALLTSRKVFSTSYYTRSDGTRFPVAITVAPIILNDKPVGAIEVFRDITKEKDVDRMKTEFISLASHQLRTPLSAMKWFLEMLLAGDAGELNNEQKEMAKNVDESNERMIALVNSLLNVSRMESGRIMVEPVPTDLNELIEGVHKEIENKIKEKGQTFVISVNENLPKINIDPKLIRQVYMNLLTNAIKYTQNGGEITVFVSKKDNEIISQITDNGYGIPAKDHDKVFQKFYRGENITKIVADGNGLGMYLVKSIIESSKGKIWFESTEGKGTTFWFSLPMSGMEAKKGEVTLDG